MPVSHAELLALRSKATVQLLYKLSKVSARVWLADYKPTIRDIYTDSEYVYAASVPNGYQIWFIFEHFEQFITQNFQVRKREGDMNVNIAILVLADGFSPFLLVSALDIALQCIMAYAAATTGLLERSRGKPRFNFIAALIHAFHEPVTKQDGFEHKKRFLSIWAAGEKDYIYWGKKGRSEMDFAIKTLEEAPAVQPFDRPSGLENFWNMLECERPKDRQRYGARWAVHYGMHLECLGKAIEQDNKRIEADYQLKNNLLVQQFASGSLDAGEDGAAEAVFALARIQALEGHSCRK